MDSRSSKEKIFQASMDLFVKNGYKKTTTKLIANKAGVNEVTIFRLFGKKKAIKVTVDVFTVTSHYVPCLHL